MALPFIGPLISGASSLIGGLLQGGQAKKERKLQKEFAQNAIQWKAADSLKAGIHPLYGLGAQTVSYSPVSVGGGLGGGIADMGQDISRAVEAGGSNEDRLLRKLQLQRAGLENELLKSQIARANSAQIGPGSPVGTDQPLPGQGIPDVFVPGLGKVKGNPALTRAQELENAYGESADVIGALNLLDAFMKQHPSTNPGTWISMLGNEWRRRVGVGRSRMRQLAR